MNIVILDGYTENPGDLSWDALAELGTLTVYDRTPKETEEIIRRIGDAEIIFTNKTPLTAEIFDRCPSIRYVGTDKKSLQVFRLLFQAFCLFFFQFHKQKFLQPLFLLQILPEYLNL